jgi:hypothetical protein
VYANNAWDVRDRSTVLRGDRGNEPKWVFVRFPDDFFFFIFFSFLPSFLFACGNVPFTEDAPLKRKSDVKLAIKKKKKTKRRSNASFTIYAYKIYGPVPYTRYKHRYD